MITFSVSSLIAMNVGWIVGQILMVNISKREDKTLLAFDSVGAVMIFSVALYLFHGV